MLEKLSTSNKDLDISTSLEFPNIDYFSILLSQNCDISRISFNNHTQCALFQTISLSFWVEMRGKVLLTFWSKLKPRTISSQIS